MFMVISVGNIWSLYRTYKIFVSSITLMVYSVTAVITRVKIWIEEMSSQIYNPVLLHKVQGEEPCIEMENFKKEDMLLVVPTEFQRDMMVKFGNNIVCLDTTHGTTMYDFLLITAIIVDEYGEGVPIAWALSNREDKGVLVHFMKSVKTRVGSLSPTIIMSDCAEQYYVAVFGRYTKKIVVYLAC